MRHILHGFENIDFRRQESPIDFALEHLEIDDFDSNGLVCIIISSLINLTRVSFSDRVIESIGEVLNFLPGIRFTLHQLLL